MIKNLFEFLYNSIFGLKSILRFDASGIGDSIGVNINVREIPIVISISHDGDNFEDLELSLYSLLNQTVCPDKIILWLSNEYELSDLPYEITRYIKNGLEIRFSDNINSYTKLINSLQENQDSIIVTAETDIYYPKDWLAKLYHSYISNPDDIHVNRTHKMRVINGNIADSDTWKKYSRKEQADFDNFPDKTGGILFPPKCFVSDVFRKDIYNKYVPNDYNVWIWFMAVISGRKIRLVKSHIKRLIVLDYIPRLKMSLKYNKFDDKISMLMKYYGQNISNKLNKIYTNQKM